MRIKGQRVVLNIRFGHTHQEYVARDAAIVPPVENLRGHILSMTLVIHLDNDEVIAFAQLIGDVEVKGCEASHVAPHLRSVHIDVCLVVDGAEVEQRATALGFRPVEGALEPYRSLVEEETLVLRVPVAWNLHSGSLIEVILNEFLGPPRLGILEKAPAGDVHTIVVVPLLLHIDDVVPVAIQRRDVTSADVAHKGKPLSSHTRQRHNKGDGKKEKTHSVHFISNFSSIFNLQFSIFNL